MSDRAPRRYLVTRHQDKAHAYISALRRRLWQRTTNVDQAEFLLCDLDIASRIKRVERAHERGIPVMYYPHAARPAIYWDGIVEAKDHACSFVVARGHKEVMLAFGYPYPIHVTGWTYCPIRPFAPRLPEDRPLRVLFGPIHPNANGWLSEPNLRANAAAHAKLLRLAQAGHIELTVRHIHDLKANGIQPPQAIGYWNGQQHYDTVRYKRVVTGLAYSDIDRADVVVAHQTLAYLAIARGVPTVMFDEQQTPTSGNSADTFRLVSSWAKYRHLLAFPLDLLDGRPLDVLRQAAASDAKIAAWRSAFIGHEFDQVEFIRAVESYL